jgi:hypothetical protein
MECTSESLGAFLRAFCPCGLVRQALNYILRGVRIGADRVKITLFLRGAERVHVPTVCQSYMVDGKIFNVFRWTEKMQMQSSKMCSGQ